MKVELFNNNLCGFDLDKVDYMILEQFKTIGSQDQIIIGTQVTAFTPRFQCVVFQELSSDKVDASKPDKAIAWIMEHWCKGKLQRKNIDGSLFLDFSRVSFMSIKESLEASVNQPGKVIFEIYATLDSGVEKLVFRDVKTGTPDFCISWIKNNYR